MSELTDLQEDLVQVRAAWRKAIKAQGYSHSGAQVSISKQNQSVKQLKDNMDAIKLEIAELQENPSGGLIISQVAPE